MIFPAGGRRHCRFSGGEAFSLSAQGLKGSDAAPVACTMQSACPGGAPHG
ncbi:hypothetical protein [Chlorobium limicola]|nr:hypothetical protein [Chlorobium limicola]